jgi:hypothetical protein
MPNTDTKSQRPTLEDDYQCLLELAQLNREKGIDKEPRCFCARSLEFILLVNGVCKMLWGYKPTDSLALISAETASSANPRCRG